MKMNMKTIMIQVIIILMSSTAIFGQGLITVGEIFDGTPLDIAAGNGILYLAQGRHLALLDPATGLRTGNYTSLPYSEQLTAVEFDSTSNRLFVATEKRVYIYNQNNNTNETWEARPPQKLLISKSFLPIQK